MNTHDFAGRCESRVLQATYPSLHIRYSMSSHETLRRKTVAIFLCHMTKNG